MTAMSNLELEKFRKIPSQHFLLEINKNGTILRNVKSKKHIYVNQQARKNLCAEVWSNQNQHIVTIHPKFGRLEYESLTYTAKMISLFSKKPIANIKVRLAERRKFIYGFRIIYPNAETRRINPSGKE